MDLDFINLILMRLVSFQVPPVEGRITKRSASTKLPGDQVWRLWPWYFVVFSIYYKVYCKFHISFLRLKQWCSKGAVYKFWFTKARPGSETGRIIPSPTFYISVLMRISPHSFYCMPLCVRKTRMRWHTFPQFLICSWKFANCGNYVITGRRHHAGVMCYLPCQSWVLQMEIKGRKLLLTTQLRRLMVTVTSVGSDGNTGPITGPRWH